MYACHTRHSVDNENDGVDMNEPRIFGTKEDEKQYSENFKSIDWGDRKALLQRLRDEKEARKR